MESSMDILSNPVVQVGAVLLVLLTGFVFKRCRPTNRTSPKPETPHHSFAPVSRDAKTCSLFLRPREHCEKRRGCRKDAGLSTESSGYSSGGSDGAADDADTAFPNQKSKGGKPPHQRSGRVKNLLLEVPKNVTTASSLLINGNAVGRMPKEASISNITGSSYGHPSAIRKGFTLKQSQVSSIGTKPTDDTLARQDNEKNSRLLATQNEVKRLQVPSSETILHIPNNVHGVPPNNGNTLTESLTWETSAATDQVIKLPSEKSDRTNWPNKAEPQQQQSNSVVARTDHSQFGFESPSLHPMTLCDQSILDTPLPTSEVSLLGPVVYSPLSSIQHPPSESEYLQQSSETFPSYTPCSLRFYDETVSDKCRVPSSHLAQFGYGSESLHTVPLPPHTKESPSETVYQQQPSETSVAHPLGKTKEAVSNEREDDLVSVGSRASKGDGDIVSLVDVGEHEEEDEAKRNEELGSQEIRKEKESEKLKTILENESIECENTTVEKAHEKDTQRVMDLKDELVEADAKVRDAETREQREEKETPRQSERESEKVHEEETKQPEIVREEDVEEQEEDKEKINVGLGSQEIREEEKESFETVNERESSERDSTTGEKVHEEDKESLKDSKDEEEVQTNINVGDIETSEHRDKKTTPSKLGIFKEMLLPGKIKKKLLKEEKTRPEEAGDADVISRASKDESLSSVDAEEEAEKKSLGGVSLKSAKEEGEKQSKWKGSIMSLRSLKSFKDVIFDQKASLFYDVKGKWEKLASGNLIISVDEKKKAELEMLDGDEQIVSHPVRKETQLVPAKGSDREYVWATEAHLKGEKKAKKMTFFVRFGEADTANQFQEEFQNAQSEETLAEILQSREKKDEGAAGDAERSAESIPEERQVTEVKEDKSGPDKEGKVEKGDQVGVEESSKRADGDQGEVKIKEDARKETEEDEKGAMKSKSDGAEKIQAKLFYDKGGKWDKQG